MKFFELKLILPLVFIACVLASCSKAPDKILSNKNGKWNAVITSHRTSTAGYDSTTVSNTVFTFVKDGNGSYIDTSGISTSFTWEYNKSLNKLSYQKTNSYVIVFDVTVMKRKTEQWQNVFTEIIALDIYTTDLKVDLTRAE